MSFAIIVRALSKRYLVERGQRHPHQPTLREVAARALSTPQRWLREGSGLHSAEDFWALRDVSFEVAPGETVGILGRNGAGKSTLLKVLCQVVVPTSGSARLRGRVGGLLEVGSGFHPELTGRENIYLSGTLLGMERREIDRKFNVIADFADLDEFLDLPVKRYSSGMNVRLAFSVAAHLEPEILLLDEVLAVGDADFQVRSANKVMEITRDEGRTVLLVGHNLSTIERLCPRSLLLDGGRLIADGPTADVIAAYEELRARDADSTTAHPATSNATASIEIAATDNAPGGNGSPPSERAMAARFLALYLPQFHPIPENDEWWGRGFSEWTNVARAQPLFRGHLQPQIPAHLGYYDLRVAETRAAQAALAARYGIEGFCYWHYWFEGKRLLERPFAEVLRSGEPDFPFCLAWANENWSRTWLGNDREVLQAQTYSPDDDRRHARWLTEAFADPRYVRVNDQPLFIIYRPTHLPEPRRTVDTLREESVRAGLPAPLLLGFNAHCPFQDVRELGFDGTIDFEPQLGDLPQVNLDEPSLSRWWRNTRDLHVPSAKLKLYDYEGARRAMQARRRGYPYYPTVMVGWDNTPRRGERGVVMVNATAEHFEAGLRDAVAQVQKRPPEDRIVFINAWNEWAEGNHLEPDLHHGLDHLEAVLRVGRGVRS